MPDDPATSGGDFSQALAQAVQHHQAGRLAQAQQIYQQLHGHFAEIAKQHSQCPSGQKGGALGEFEPGQMVKEFDDVVFSAEVNKTHGPVQTQFGYHLIEITSRED